MSYPPGYLLSGIVTKEGDYRHRPVYHLKHGGKITHIIANKVQFIDDGDKVTFKIDVIIKPTTGTFTNTLVYEVPKNNRIVIDYSVGGIIDAAISNLGDETTIRSLVTDALSSALLEGVDLQHYLDYHALEWSEEVFYKWWLTHRVYRRLWHLDLRNKQIDELCKYYRVDIGHLYDIIVKNPLHAAPLEQNYALLLCTKFGIKCTLEDKSVAMIARYIYADVTKNRNTYMRQSSLEKAWPNVVNYAKQLDRDYDLTRYNFVNSVGISTDIIQFHYILEAERFIADFVEELLDKPDYNIIEIECDDSIRNDEAQYDALITAQRKRICLWVGGPGRGKTRCIRELIRNYCARGEQCVLTAFTGKAVSRMREVVGNDIPGFGDYVTIVTIHSLIQKMGGMYGSKKCIKRLGHVVIDEGSMLSTPLFFEFISIYRDVIDSLLIVGDIDQLQPIEWGGCMNQLIKSDCITICKFNYNYRAINDVYCKDENGNIAVTPHCKQIRGGIDHVLIEYKELLEAGKQYSDIIILTPTNDVANLINDLCQRHRIESTKIGDREQPSVTDGAGHRFVLGDSIILKKNLRNNTQANGDIGVVTRICKPAKKIYVTFGEHEQVFTLCLDADEGEFNHHSRGSDLPTTNDIKLAYCLTIHSCQGSEWNNELFVVLSSEVSVDFFNFYMINTAIPRAREYVAIIGDIDKVNKYFKLIPKARNETLGSRIHNST